MSEFELTKSSYIEKHNASLVAGLTHEDFRRQKIDWVAEIIKRESPKHILDFGFGTGELLEDILSFRLRHSEASLILSGIEPSQSLRQELSARHSPETFRRILPALGDIENESIDLITCFNVLHHIPPPERKELAAQMILKLAPRGRLLIWEHNPYNPATRIIVGRCEYDEDAVLLSRRETQNLFSALEIESSHYVNTTPPSIQKFAFFRWVEHALRFIPTGAQYRITFRKKI